MSIRTAAIAVALLATAPLAHAQDADHGTTQLKNVVVTATRTPQSTNDTLAATTVVTHKDIERMQATSVQDILRHTPGVNIANQGGPGKLTSIFMRGTASTHVLVLVDGVRYSDVTSGMPQIQDLPVDDIKRIEIVRGPRSSLYGSDAIGGVIQIFTKNGEGVEGAHPYFNINAGSHGLYGGHAGLTESAGNFHYNIDVGGTHTRGINATTPANSSYDPDRDGYHRVTASFRGGYDLSQSWKLGFHVLQDNGATDLDSFNRKAKHRHRVVGLKLSGDPLAFWHTRISVGHTRYHAQRIGAFPSETQSRETSISFLNDLQLNKNNQLTVGLDYLVDTGKTSGYNKHRDNKGAFIQYLGNWGRSEIQLSMRGDDNEQFGGHRTGSATYGFHFNDVYTLSLSYGTAFKAPKLDYLYFTPLNNTNLKPEKSESYEVGFAAKHKWMHWSLHAYQTNIDDLIVSDLTTGFVPYNISKARIRGVEFASGVTVHNWLVNLNATYMKPENRSSGTDRGNDLRRRSRYVGQLDIDRKFLERYSAGVSLHWEGSRYEDADNTNKLHDFVLLGLRGSVDVTDALQIQAKISNLFNEKYYTAYSFNAPGRTFYVNLRYHP